LVENLLFKKLLDLLVKMMEKLFQKNLLKLDCKKAGRLISEAVRELLTARPNLLRVKAKLTEAERLCPISSEELLSAQKMLETLQEIEKKYRPKRLAVRKKALAKKKAVAKKKVTRKRTVAKKKAVALKKKVVKKKTKVKARR